VSWNRIAYLLSALALFLLYTDRQKGNWVDCLRAQGLRIYGTKWCPYTKDLQSDFGRHWKKVTFIDCDADPQTCKSEGIKGYPSATLERGVNRNMILSVDSVKELVDLSNCVAVRRRKLIVEGQPRASQKAATDVDKSPVR